MAQAAVPRPLSLDEFFRLRRIADPQVSPDGRWVVYTLATPDLEANQLVSALWVAPTAGDAPPRQLTNPQKSDRHPRWSPDSGRILFESSRSGESQLWVIDVGGGEARQLTKLASEASSALWSPDGKSIAFVSSVYPEYSTQPFAESDAAHRKRKESAEKDPVKVRSFTRLFFRHWDSWVEDKRQHLLLVSYDAATGTASEPRDLTPGDWDANPTSSTFSAGDDFCFSPDGRWLYFTAPPKKDEAWSTNYDLWRVPVTGGQPEQLTAGNTAADSCPRFSPDGRWLAYRAQSRSGFEADRWQLYVVPADATAANWQPRSLTAELDRSVDGLIWQAGSDGLYFTAEEDGGTPVFRVSLAGQITRHAVGGAYSGLSISREGKLVAQRATMRTPPEPVWVAARAGGEPTPLDRSNAPRLAELDLPTAESLRVPGAGGTPMQMWVLKPPGFSPDRKWPVVYLVHGGPQGAWDDGWSFRWNPQLWAARGYVVALPNPRGSTGFGQQYVDEISGDWGGRCYEDLMAGVAWLERQPYVDTARLAAAGASFGGYMMNWFAGHTDKFRTLICHCGVYNFDSMYATTDELWFDEWEHGGPPWGRRESYERHSPHRFADKFRTPMLIIHNDQDFRVPVSEGYQLFTTLQRLGIESKLLNFTEESHWVLKPAASRRWHEEVFGWLEKYCPAGGK